jgi:DNA-binding XRE family transcriptional regulator
LAEPSSGPGAEPFAAEPIEVVPVVVLSQVFPARPSSIPDIRNFVRRCLAESPLTEEGTREVGETVFRALLDAAGPTGSINVAFRIFPEHVEVDVLHSDTQLGPAAYAALTGAATAQSAPLMPGSADSVGAGSGAPALGGLAGPGSGGLGGVGLGGVAGSGSGGPADLAPPGPVSLGGPGQPATFAEWMSSALRSQNMTQEAAARQLGVSVKTISRWVGGATEPRMRDLRRIQEVFGSLPLDVGR